MKKVSKVVIFSFIFTSLAMLLMVSIHAEGFAAAEEKRTATAIWFEDNLGWLIGIPSGTVLAGIMEFVFLFRKNRSYAKDLSSNMLMRGNVKKFIDEAKAQNVKIENFVSKTEQQVVDVNNKVDNALTKIDNTCESIKDLQNENQVIVVSLNKLVEVLALMASQDKDMVSNGTAEKINSIVIKDNK